ncbi:hypothetical protein SUGI_0604990 [Cryptomeria japonica]|nr:hypothetical protein SUGI_0604990 [Cryptomeria japonica]
MYNNTSNSTATSASSHSQWRWPVPFLFGGLVAMLVLIAFAFVILACSYCTSKNVQNAPDSTADELKEVSVEDDEEKVVVIMAGNDIPTFLAKPASTNFQIKI